MKNRFATCHILYTISWTGCLFLFNKCLWARRCTVRWKMFFLCQNKSVTLAMPLLTTQLLVLESNSLSIRCFQYHNGIFYQCCFHYLFVYHRTPHGVWKSLLDESEKKAKQRLAISEELQGQMAESMKTLKSNKAQVFKKVCVTQ